MLRIFLRRLAITVPLLLGVSFFVFLLLDLAPGDAALRIAGETATKEQVQEVRHELHLDQPFASRYVRYVSHAARGDLGESFSTKEKIDDLILGRLSVTLSLASLALVFALVLGVGMGIAAALRPNRLTDRLVAVICSLSVSTPPFLIGLFLVIWLATTRTWLPATGYAPVADGVLEWLKHLLLPALSLAWLPAAELARQLRGSLIEALDRDYVMAAHAKGVSPRRVVFKHALKNAAIPPVTVLGFRIAQMLGGTVVVERLFLLPGLGTLTIEAVQARDYVVVLGVVLFLTLVVMVVNLLVDATYVYFNPKLRTA